jgi:hypothetical protein
MLIESVSKPSYSDDPECMALQADGKIVLGGAQFDNQPEPNQGFDFWLSRYMATEDPLRFKIQDLPLQIRGTAGNDIVQIMDKGTATPAVFSSDLTRLQPFNIFDPIYVDTVDGALIAAKPPAAPCHAPQYDEAICMTARSTWTDSFWTADQPGSYGSPEWDGVGVVGDDVVYMRTTNDPNDRTAIDPNYHGVDFAAKLGGH